MRISKPKMRLSSKLFLLVIFLCIISVTVMAVYINRTSRRELRNLASGQYGIHQLMQSKLVASAIEKYFDRFISHLYFMANANPILSLTAPPDALFYKVYDSLQEVTSIRFLSINGHLMFVHPFDGFRRELIGKDYSTAPFYKKALTTGNISISSLLYNEENKPRIRIAIPIFEKNIPKKNNTDRLATEKIIPQIKGVLVGSFDPIKVLNKITADIVSDKISYAWVLDSKGTFLMHHIKEFEGKSSFGARKEKNPDLSYEKIENIQQKMIRGMEGTDNYISGWHREQKGYIEKFVAYSPVKIADTTWSVAISSPMNALDTIIKKKEKYEYYTLFFIVSVFLSGGVFLFRDRYQWYVSLEQSLKINEQKLTAITQASPVGISLVKQRKIYWANETLHTIFGYEYDELLGKNARIIYQDHSTYLRVGETLYPDESSPKIFQSIGQCVKKDGTTFHCSLRSCPLNASDLSQGFIVVVADVSERVEFEQENNRLKDHIIKTQRTEAIGILASGIAHDFNNILFPITGYAEILLWDANEGSDTHEYLQNILKASTRAKDLISQILSFSRQKESEKSPVLVQPIVKETLKLLKKTIPTTITIVQQIDMNCRMIMADSTQIHQVIMNLCTNAYQAMEETGGTLTVELRETQIKEYDSRHMLELTPGDYIELSISDTGIGMAKETVLKIFEPYFTTKQSGDGTGLGLAVAQGIVKKAGGDIKVTSEPKKGTCFSIYLPIIDSNMEHTDIPAVQDGFQTGKGHILLVDDEEQIVAMEQKILQRLGYKTTACTSSRNALETFKNNPDAYDVIITDMTMPELTGDKLVEALKKINPDIPIIICTGFQKNHTKEWLDSLNVQGFLMKPVKMKELSKLIYNMIGPK